MFSMSMLVVSLVLFAVAIYNFHPKIQRRQERGWQARLPGVYLIGDPGFVVTIVQVSRKPWIGWLCIALAMLADLAGYLFV